jgi:hypothetical protein
MGQVTDHGIECLKQQGEGLILGIDPGGKGGIGFIDVKKGEYVEVIDLPVIEMEWEGVKRKRKRVMLDLNGINAGLAMCRGLIKHVYIEDQLTVPDQSVQSMRTTFENFGKLVGKFHTFGIPHTVVMSSAWKAKMMRGMPKGKGSAMVRCSQLYPEAQIHGPKGGKLDGRAEALLIARYGWMKDWK